MGQRLLLSSTTHFNGRKSNTVSDAFLNLCLAQRQKHKGPSPCSAFAQAKGEDSCCLIWRHLSLHGSRPGASSPSGLFLPSIFLQECSRSFCLHELGPSSVLEARLDPIPLPGTRLGPTHGPPLSRKHPRLQPDCAVIQWNDLLRGRGLWRSMASQEQHGCSVGSDSVCSATPTRA